MEDQRLGAALRLLRRRHGWSQAALAARAGLSPATVSRTERGHAASLSVRSLRALAAQLDVRVQLVPRWRGGEIDRLLGAGHSAMHERLARLLAEHAGWEHQAEVTFSIYGERGSIDILAWHRTTHALLVVELKTTIEDVQALLAQVDRYRRLAGAIARERGWKPGEVSAWVVVADSRTNRRRLARHVTVLRTAFPVDGRGMRGWLRAPREAVSALSFLPADHPRNAGRDGSGGSGPGGGRRTRGRA